MASARFAWGIDIGNRALKAVRLSRDGDGLRIDDFDIIEHEHVLSNAGDNRDSLIQSALANFVQRHPMKNSVAAIGVSGQASFARFIKLPPVEPKKIPEIVKFEAIQQIPFPLDEVEWSYQLFQTPDSPEVEVGIFAMRKDLIGRHMQFFTEVDMNVQVVQMNPLAVYNAMYYDQKLKGTTMIVDLGAENTDLIICDNDSVWMRSIPIGGNNFTETLVKAFKLPFGKAEDLKRNAATSKYARQIFQAMRPVFADLVAEIQRSVGFYASVHRDSRIQKIIAIGGTFRLPGLQKYLQQNMSLDVERLDNISAGVPTDPKLAATFNENLLSAVSPYGLAVQAMGEGKITSSLLPAAIRRERLWKSKTKVFAAAAACCCVGTTIALGGWWYRNLEYENAASVRQEISRVVGEAGNLEKGWSDLSTSGDTERQLITNVQSLQQYRDVWRKLLQDLYTSIPLPQREVQDGLAQTPADVSKIKSIPRDKREQVVIRSVSTKTYYPDLTQVLKDADDSDAMNKMAAYVSKGAGAAVAAIPVGDAGGEAAATDFAAMGLPAPAGTATGTAGAGKARGLILTIRCTSPHAQAHTLLVGKLTEALKKIRPDEKDPQKLYEVVKINLVRASKVIDDAELRTELVKNFTDMRSRPTAAPNTPGAQPAAPRGFAPPPIAGARRGAAAPPQAQQQPALPDDVAPFRDRIVEDEDMRNDWSLTLTVIVRLDPTPYTPPAPAPTAAAQ